MGGGKVPIRILSSKKEFRFLSIIYNNIISNSRKRRKIKISRKTAARYDIRVTNMRKIRYYIMSSRRPIKNVVYILLYVGSENIAKQNIIFKKLGLYFNVNFLSVE